MDDVFLRDFLLRDGSQSGAFDAADHLGMDLVATIYQAENSFFWRFHDFVALYAEHQGKPHPLPLHQKRTVNFAGPVEINYRRR